jgi:hypothetical protein
MLVGTAPLDELVAHAATMTGFGTEAVVLPDADVFQAMFEMHIGGREVSLPPGLHPTAVPTFTAQVWRCPESPWGPFSLAQGRVGSRSGLRPRGHVQGCVCDNERATEALRARWGFPAHTGVVNLRHHYDAVEASVTVDGHAVLSLRGTNPEPLGTGDIVYSASVALARTPRGLRLVQIDSDIEVTRAERLRPHLDAFDADGFGVHPSVQPYHPVSASIALGTITLQRLRFVCRPDELAFTGTEPTEEAHR